MTDLTKLYADMTEHETNTVDAQCGACGHNWSHHFRTPCLPSKFAEQVAGMACPKCEATESIAISAQERD